jgi:hypothetical protein
MPPTSRALGTPRGGRPTTDRQSRFAGGKLAALLAVAVLLLVGCGGGGGADASAPPPPSPLGPGESAYDDPAVYSSAAGAALAGAEEAAAVTRHSVTVGGTRIDYTARAGHLIARHPTTAAAQASMFYVAYTADDAGGAQMPARPVTFFSAKASSSCSRSTSRAVTTVSTMGLFMSTLNGLAIKRPSANPASRVSMR